MYPYNFYLLFQNHNAIFPYNLTHNFISIILCIQIIPSRYFNTIILCIHIISSRFLKKIIPCIHITCIHNFISIVSYNIKKDITYLWVPWLGTGVLPWLNRNKTSFLINRFNRKSRTLMFIVDFDQSKYWCEGTHISWHTTSLDMHPTRAAEFGAPRMHLWQTSKVKLIDWACSIFQEHSAHVSLILAPFPNTGWEKGKFISWQHYSMWPVGNNEKA